MLVLSPNWLPGTSFSRKKRLLIAGNYCSSIILIGCEVLMTMMMVVVMMMIMAMMMKKVKFASKLNSQILLECVKVFDVLQYLIILESFFVVCNICHTYKSCRF